MRRRVTAWWAASAAVAMVLAACSSAAKPAAPASTTTTVPAPARLLTITIPAPDGEIAPTWLRFVGYGKTLGYQAPPRANVLLPAGYDPHKHYPLIVFLDGLGTNYATWHDTGLDKPFDHLGAIVVMPEGANGWYTDWWNNATRGDPSWETYYLDTVIPTILQRYPILPARRDHALIGISMGGLGATYLGGRLPGFFGSVASLSGFVDPQWEAAVTQPAMGSFSYAKQNGDNDTDPIYGDPSGFYSEGHNPTRLVGNLANTRLFVSTGTATPSTSDPHPTQSELTDEAIIYPMSQLYHQALLTAGVPATYQVHTGAHALPDFSDEITAMLQWGLFNPVADNVPSWTNDTVATHGQLWDLNYRFTRAPTRVVHFTQSGTTLSISAAGSPVTITLANGCAIHTATPATVHLPDRARISPLNPDKVGTTACT